MADNVLDVSGLSKRFGDLQVLFDVSLKVDTGETRLIHTLRGVGYVLREPR